MAPKVRDMTTGIQDEVVSLIREGGATVVQPDGDVDDLKWDGGEPGRHAGRSHIR